MNHGPLIFLAALLGMAGSWFGFVLVPEAQLGTLQPTNSLAQSAYPLDRPGLAKAGLQVYRANGCAYCHSQQVQQTGTLFDVLLGEAGTHRAAAAGALRNVKPELSETEAARILISLPATILTGHDRQAADQAIKTLNTSGAKAALGIR